jgi:YidC/Oxa1 family membrane protein insertase
MEKQTLLAVLLCILVMIGFMFARELLFPPPPAQTSTGQISSGTQDGAASAFPQAQPETDISQYLEFSEEPSELSAGAPSGETVLLREITIDTRLLKVVLTNVGGDIISFQLKEHKDKGEPVDMILSGNAGSQAFSLAFGNTEDLVARRISPVKRNFQVRQISDLIVEFYQDFEALSGGSFSLTKRYEFKPDEYMFELTIMLNGGNSSSSFNFQGASYTLVFGPQIGPKFEKLDQRYEYRRYLTYKGKMKTEKVNEREPLLINSNPSWAAIAGKYFTLIALPYASQYELAFSAKSESGIPGASRLYITRPVSGSSRIEDKYHFYLGPKNQETLSVYERGDNSFRLRETGVIEVADTKGFLAPLERILKQLLQVFHRIIPNYGVAIILLTLLVKIVLFPLTKKGSESTQRMQALAPRIKEIQDKYKENPQKMNAEMAEFYKKEGYNPLSGCLPMLLQIPIFFAMYNLFNNHFDLRGAEFIPGWIPDLSRPEAIFNFPDNFKLPFLGWTAIRLLPFIYVGSQLLYGRVNGTPDQKGNAQMKLMLYVMPIVFFFVLYDVPSGLLLYWIMSNLLTLVQQLIINKYLALKKPVATVQKPVIAPGGPKRKKKK